MPIKTKQEIKTEIDQYFFTNNENLITGDQLNEILTDLNDSEQSGSIGGSSSSGTLDLIQLSDGASGFTSSTNFVYTASTGTFTHGSGNVASGVNSHAEGLYTTASGDDSHAEGILGYAIGAISHVEGNGCSATGNSSHAEGISTIANGTYSHTEGFHTKANGTSSHVGGNVNVSDADDSAIFAGSANTLTSTAIGSSIIASLNITGTEPYTLYTNKIQTNTVSATTIYSGSTNLSTLISNSINNSSYWNRTGTTTYLKNSGDITYLSGNVGIGISVPTQKLDVASTTAKVAIFDNSSIGAGKGGELLLQHNNASSNRTTYASLKGYAYDGTAGGEKGYLVLNTMRSGTLTEAVRILDTGYVGIGNVLATERLHIGANDTNNNIFVAWNANNGETAGTLRSALIFGERADTQVNAGNAWKYKIGTIAGDSLYGSDLAFMRTTRGGVTDNPDITIKENGNVYIGTTTGTTKVNVAGTINTTGYSISGTTGVSGTFTTADAKTVTVTNGLITSII